MTIESTRAAMLRYFDQDDFSTLADDVVYTVMATGQEARGPQAVQAMIHDLYSVAFKAGVEGRVRLFGDGQAMFEGDFVGRQIGEYAGIPATGKEVRVPLCVVYFLKDDRIQRAHIYFEIPALLRQLGE
jgi:predicted ester cyclase